MKLQITIDGRAYQVEVELMEEEPAPQIEEPLPAPPALTPAAAELDGDPDVCRSPVNGLVVKVNAEAGQWVEAGTLLAVLEAMKMETNIAAQRAGRIRTVHVKPGDAVKVHQALVEFEEEACNGNG